MSSTVDKRIVQMVFDNDAFKSGIETTLTYLDKLKTKLDFGGIADTASQEFAKIESAANGTEFSTLANNVESISDRFSSLGIVGMTVLSNLTNSAVNTGKSIISSIISPIVEGGKTRALNIEQAKFQFEGLGMDVEAAMASANEAVTGTAYGLDAAAKAAAQFGASGMQAGDDMTSALRGIAGVAAMTGSDYESIANIFTTVAGNGRLMGDQLNQLAARGINAAATLATQLGVTESEVRSMVSSGEISFETFYKAMDNAFGEHAKDANNTFTGSLSNMKAALSRIGAEVATPAYQNLRDFFNALTPVINSIKTALGPMFTMLSEGMSAASQAAVSFLGSLNLSEDLVEPLANVESILRALASVFVSIGKVLLGVVSPILKAFSETLGTTILELLVKIAEGIKNFTDQFEITDEVSNNIYNTFYGIFSILSLIARVLVTVTGLIAKPVFNIAYRILTFILEVLLAITQVLGTITRTIKNLYTSIMSLDAVQVILNSIIFVIDSVLTLLDNIYKKLKTIATTAATKAVNLLATAFQALADVILLVASGIDVVVSAIITIVSALTDKIVAFVKATYELPIVQEYVTKVGDAFAYLKSNSIGILEKIVKSIKNVITVVRDKLTPIFDTAASAIKKFAEIAKNAIDEFDLPSMEEFLESLVKLIKDTGEKLTTSFDTAKEFVVNLITRIKELASTNFTNFISNLVKIKDSIAEIVDISGKLEWIKDFFTNAVSGVKSFGNAAYDATTTAQNAMSTFLEWVQKKFSEVTLGDIVATALGTSMILFMYRFTEFTESLTQLSGFLAKIQKGIAGVLKSISGMFDSISQYFKDKGKVAVIDSVRNLILAFVALAGALALLAAMDQDKVRSSGEMLIAIMAVTGVLVAALTAIAKISTPEQIGAVATELLAFSGALAIIAVALKILGDCDATDLGTKILAMTVLMGELVALIAILGKLEVSGDLKVGTGSLLAIAASLLIMAGALNRLATIDVNSIVPALALVTFLISFMAILGKINSKGGSWQTAASILAMAVSIGILTIALEKLAKMDSDNVKTSLERLIEIAVVLSLLMVALSVAGKATVGAGAAILMISAAIVVLTVAMNQLGLIDDTTLQRAEKVILSLMAMFAVLISVTKFAGQYATGAGSAILMMSGSLLVISGAMLILSMMDPDDLARVTLAISILLGMFALIVASMSNIKNAKETMTAMGVTLVALAGIMAVLSLLEPKNLLASAVSIGLVLAAFALSLAATDKIKTDCKIQLLYMVGLIAILAGIITALALIAPEGAIQAAGSISILLTAMTANMAILSKVKQVSDKAYLGMLAMSGIVAILGGVLAAISAFGGINNSIEMATGLSELLIALTACTAILGKVEVKPTAVAEGVAGIAILVAGVTAIMAALAGINSLAPDMAEFLTTSIPVLEAIGSGLGTFIGSIVGGVIGGIGAGATVGLILVAENLSTFADKLQPFLDSVSNVDDNALSCVSRVSEMILMLCAADFVNSLNILGIGGSALSDISYTLPLLADGIVAFSDKLKDADVESITNSVEVAEAFLGILNYIDNNGGLLQVVTGDKATGMGQLALYIGDFGKALATYSQAVKDLDTESIYNSIEPAKKFLEVVDLIPNNGGLLQVFTGDKATGMEQLALYMAHFGEALTSYSQNVKSLNARTLEDSIEPAKKFLEVVDLMPNNGGLLQVVTGDSATGMEQLALYMAHFGQSLKDYGDSVVGLNSDAISASLQPAKDLIDVLNTVAPEGGIVELFAGSTAWGDEALCNNIVSLGEALTTFAENCQATDFNSSSVNDGISLAESMIKAFNTVNPSGGVESWWFGDQSNSLNWLKENIGDFGEALKDFADKTSGIKSYLTYGAVETAKGLVTIFNMIDETGGWESLKNGTKTESLSGIAETAGQLGKAVNEFYDSVKNIKADVNVDSAVSVLTSLVDAYSVIASMSGTVTETSGMVTTSVTYNGLEKLGDFMLTLVPLGNALMQFSKSIGNMNVSNSRGAAETLKCIGEAVNQIKDVDFSNIGGRVEEFGARYNSFANKCSEVDSAVIDAFVENLAKVRDGINSFTTNIDLSKLETLPETFKNLGTSIGDSLSSGISDQSDKCSNAMSSVLRQVAAAGVKSLNEYKSLGRSMMTYLARGISDGQSTVENAVRSATANASSVISSDGFYRAGIMCVKGFANGLSDPDSRYSVVQAATSMAKDAVNAVETTTQVSSPAKVFIRIGEYCSEGMAIGITNLSGMVSTAAGDMAGSAIDTATMALDSMSTAVYGLDGLTPTVSPVLDVTDLRLGAMSVNSMFSDSSAVKFAATISADMKTQNDAMADLLDSIQNGIDSSNSRVIDAVNGVASTISEQQSEFSLYLDTNKFASTIAKPIDKQLGVISRRKSLA